MLDDVGGVPESASGTARVVSLADIRRDDANQIRGKTDDGTVQRYVNVLRGALEDDRKPTEVFPPITLADIDGVLTLVDGFHRTQAFAECGERAINATVVPCSSFEKARWMAVLGNREHGLPLGSSRDASHNAFHAYMQAEQFRRRVGRRFVYRSYRGISADLGGLMAKSTVEREMKKHYPKIAAHMSDDRPLRDTLPKPKDPEEVYAAEAVEMAKAAQALAAGITSPQRRQQVAQALHDAMQAVLAGAAFDPTPF